MHEVSVGLAVHRQIVVDTGRVIIPVVAFREPTGLRAANLFSFQTTWFSSPQLRFCFYCKHIGCSLGPIICMGGVLGFVYNSMRF